MLAASKVGDPNLQEETVTNAAAIVNDLTNQITGMQASQNIGMKAVATGTGTPAANEAAPGTKSDAEGTAPKPAPAQVNEIQKSDTATQAAGTDTKATPADPKQESSSKKKEKKGLRKLIPF